jgi:hypothetical protein
MNTDISVYLFHHHALSHGNGSYSDESRIQNFEIHHRVLLLSIDRYIEKLLFNTVSNMRRQTLVGQSQIVGSPSYRLSALNGQPYRSLRILKWMFRFVKWSLDQVKMHVVEEV